MRRNQLYSRSMRWMREKENSTWFCRMQKWKHNFVRLWNWCRWYSFNGLKNALCVRKFRFCVQRAIFHFIKKFCSIHFCMVANCVELLKACIPIRNVKIKWNSFKWNSRQLCHWVKYCYICMINDPRRDSLWLGFKYVLRVQWTLLFA